MSSSTLFPASVVGSMPRPDFVRDLVMGDHTLSPEQYEHQMDAAVRYVSEGVDPASAAAIALDLHTRFGARLTHALGDDVEANSGLVEEQHLGRVQ